jgi:thioredoxin-related protein
MKHRNHLRAGALFAAMLAYGSPLAAAELVMVEQAGCHWCARWNAEIAHIYPKTEEGQRAPLRRVDLRDLPVDVTFTSKPVFTPTFVLVDNGEELGRIEGYAGDQFFWFLVRELLDAHPQATTVIQ